MGAETDPRGVCGFDPDENPPCASRIPEYYKATPMFLLHEYKKNVQKRQSKFVKAG